MEPNFCPGGTSAHWVHQCRPVPVDMNSNPVSMFQRSWPAAAGFHGPSHLRPGLLQPPPALPRWSRPLFECHGQMDALTHLQLEMLPSIVRESLSVLDRQGPVVLQECFHAGGFCHLIEVPCHQGACGVPSRQVSEERPPMTGTSSIMADARCDGAAGRLKEEEEEKESALERSRRSIPLDDADEGATGPQELHQAKAQAVPAEDHPLHTVMVDDANIVACGATDGPTSPPSCHSPQDSTPTTEPTPGTSAFTQNEGPETRDQNLITEVHMADLDYLAQEVVKLRQQKRKVTRCCDCTERAQQAELRLLALQYTACIQHCYRLYYTCAEGNLLHPELADAGVLQTTLQDLDSDYERMRQQVVEGVALHKLQPLSVPCDRLAAGAPYTPSQLLDSVLAASWSRKSVNHKASWEMSAGGERQRGGDGQGAEEEDNRTAGDTKQEDRQMWSPCEDICSSEAWYDAQEDLQPPGGAAAAGPDGEDAESCVLCVSNLPANVTQTDLILLLEDYEPCDVTTVTTRSNWRVAIVTVNDPQSADTAVRELNGRRVRGRLLRVQRVGRGGGRRRSHNRAEGQGPQTPLDPVEPQVTPAAINIQTAVSAAFVETATCPPQHELQHADGAPPRGEETAQRGHLVEAEAHTAGRPELGELETASERRVT